MSLNLAKCYICLMLHLYLGFNQLLSALSISELLYDFALVNLNEFLYLALSLNRTSCEKDIYIYNPVFV